MTVAVLILVTVVVVTCQGDFSASTTALAGCRKNRLRDTSTDLKRSKWVDDKARQQVK